MLNEVGYILVLLVRCHLLIIICIAIGGRRGGREGGREEGLVSTQSTPRDEI